MNTFGMKANVLESKNRFYLFAIVKLQAKTITTGKTRVVINFIASYGMLFYIARASF
jgi:hypothetical protein